jgi:hypothetical protein
MYYIYRFSYIEPPLHPRDEADLVMMNDISDVLLDSVLLGFSVIADWPIILLGVVFV